ncbi:MAG: hypothetical protein US62_C0006G0026 [Candidatus Woesebacteria bacterium GW2011_GWA1_37_8]|uniref:Uncharacterized protein n=1 Tax=Candidatus Woesebacteria bacterium GW2011_GWA1_37_8 TaxID=1618546 RepID=A0A0G0I4W0_9BACT|nr:MAG: hypothetical protein US39_C0004G0050 [Microgenomates group bacterium GW2011_GWC1_37_12b]KKQ46015.1 MAG: hypothetical protein US62_C0006G0026 [Candidatus Woesebacteria bacterium GW2011_GWA1_37_8]
MNKINIGVIGLGYWGPNYLRNFLRCEGVGQLWGCDISDSILTKIGKSFPQVQLVKDYHTLLEDKNINLLAIATPPETHFKIATDALKAGKHVFIAKPLTTNSKDALKLLKLAKQKKLLLHCDLTYLYTSGVRKIKELVSKKAIGKPLFYDSIRTNLGLFQNNANVVWDLAPHDLSILSFCFSLIPKSVFAVASKHFRKLHHEEVAHITIKYTHNFIAHIHVSWLSPVKIRSIFIGGTKKMISFDDVQPDEKVKIYDKGVDLPTESITPFKPIYRSGDIVIPRLDNNEALWIEINEVVNNIKNKTINYDIADLAVDNLLLLEACDKSIKHNKLIVL